MAGLNRRDFLKAMGLTGATAAGACAWDNNRYVTPIEAVLPYVVKPDQVTPGTPTFFATTITSGPHAYPVLARHRDGRVINVESNPHSGRHSGVPKGALLELQRLYSPDRFKAPRKGEESLSWEDGLTHLANAVKSANDAGKKVAYLGPYRSGPIVKLIQDYTGGNAVFWEALGHADEATAWDALFGGRELPKYDLTDARYVLSFGAPFLSWWGSPEMESQYAAARNPNHDHFITRFALMSPHMDQVGANADDWYPCQAGSQAHIAFAVAKLVAAKKGYSGHATAILDRIDLKAAAAQAGISEGDLDEVATHFSEADGAVALPGATEDTDLAIATFLINVVSGNGGKTFSGGGYSAPIHGFSDLSALIDQMKSGQIGVLLLDDVNPAHSLPADAKFAEAVKAVDFVAGLSSHPDESNALATVILPTSSAFEDWGYEVTANGACVLRQPAMTALWDTRSMGDILLATARSAGITVAAPDLEPTEEGAGEEEAAAAAPAAGPFDAPNWQEYVFARWHENFGSGDWTKALHDGAFTATTASVTPEIQATDYRFAPRTLGEGVGVVLYAHPHRFDGRYANQPWAQEIADPMTGHVWDSWLEVSPDLFDGTFSKNDEVAVKSASGEVNIGAVRYRGLAKNTVAIALGQGHTEANGRYANGTGKNGFSLSAVNTDSFGNLLLNPTATVTGTGKSADLVSTFGQGSDPRTKGGDGNRDWGVSVNADELAKLGDAEQHGHDIGKLTGIHHFKRDPRLEAAHKAGKKDMLDFYGEPDHPNYRFGMTVDTNACNGCGACVIACYAENNLPIVGKPLIKKGREMNWLRINRYWEEDEVSDGSDRPQFDVQFVPMMCQQCGHAPCESVCPVLATYHNIDGLNAMIYNRCVGTRYCANNCPYVVRRFNFHSYKWPEPFNLQLNPEVSVRTMGVMEKCTFCVQRTRDVKIAYRDQGFTEKVPDAALEKLPACANACPTDALTFGDRNSESSKVSKLSQSTRSYTILAELNTFSAVNYLAKANPHMQLPKHYHHGAGHGGSDDHGASHGDEHPHGNEEKHPKPSETHHEGGH